MLKYKIQNRLLRAYERHSHFFKRITLTTFATFQFIGNSVSFQRLFVIFGSQGLTNTDRHVYSC